VLNSRVTEQRPGSRTETMKLLQSLFLLALIAIGGAVGYWYAETNQ